MIRDKKPAHTLDLTVKLKTQVNIWEMNATWIMDGKDNLRRSEPKISKLSP